jgi:hypothetical protein
MPTIPDIAIGSIVAATIAALISLFGLIVSKDQKTSEFRQAWIDALRSELAEVIAHANGIHGVAMADYSNPKEMWEAARAHFVGINLAISRIRLRLNPSEPSSQAVLKEIEKLESHLNPGAINDAVLSTIEKELITTAHILLKKEWIRVRSGEITFRVTKWLAVILVVSGITFLAFKLLSENP